ncbi:ribosomal L7Ae/L30e/S12e/Gadd45 family protein [Tissierella praeacuta]|uniref:Large subunit ribosomal protein L7A n=1 Tax=Tissierella praeacuta DSM 18095 TaxID=1123404 RepID=A0A1M4ZS39_9FIRM|nr:ribosomal L7Ae/L30e/S12e/Gadd45 family protein [Tissierella praeacuta]HAE91953.1 50S ribosomal protein L7ae-like protein [Tissierella sp.]MBU5256355.1 ribosomal L7Ae/L30e/S12e/Gadd45 family protein [Tissierella praeacuta]TCU69716.1 large subunit ribosomal protein L7A [Tissierella praeacuta]SHF20859.1 large subunit ribosomal protein L7A [Tissierella praeacuta DSM 18095]SUP03314.1 Ribosome-associated protein L7Ae-like [Tissierella praeacuta]
MLSKLNANNKIVGAKQVKRALNSQEIEAVFIAKDAENKITDEIKEICIDKHIQVIYVDNMKKLGDACGIDVNAATAALVK